MFTVDHADYSEIFANYCKQKAFFPIIGSVLLDEQNGTVYVDNPIAPKQFYVEHAFGFAQIFGPSNQHFEAALRNRLIVNRSFFPPKIRLYTPHLPEFLLSGHYESMRSERCRFIFAKSADTLPRPRLGFSHAGNIVRLEFVDENNVHEIENCFGLTTRFWRTRQDFVAKSHAVAAYIDNQPAAICYAAGIADGRAEIDVLTLPAYQKRGLGKLVVSCFNSRILETGLTPLWDCFTNNEGSIALCQSSGFVPVGESYPFFTINKHDMN